MLRPETAAGGQVLETHVKKGKDLVDRTAQPQEHSNSPQVNLRWIFSINQPVQSQVNSTGQTAFQHPRSEPEDSG